MRNKTQGGYYMSNELRDIANRLCQYDTVADGYEIITAVKRNDGAWDLTIRAMAIKDKKQEATDDNN